MMVGLFGSSQINIFLILFFFKCSFYYSLQHFIPPGTAKIKGIDFYVDKTEVTNRAWAEYLWYVRNHYGENSIEYKAALPDSAIWHSVYSGEICSIHNKYANYPIVGVSYEQAVQFCRWRSKQVNTKFKKYQTTYQLPSIKQWEIIFEHVEKNKRFHDTLYPYNRHKKILGLCDNVSEMTLTSKIAKGGNWKNHEKCNEITKYDSSKNWLGFRCIAYYKAK